MSMLGHSQARNMDDTAEDTASMAGSEDSSQDGFAGDMQSQHGARKAGSIASTYWRAERQDRGALSVLDERCAWLSGLLLPATVCAVQSRAVTGSFVVSCHICQAC